MLSTPDLSGRPSLPRWLVALCAAVLLSLHAWMALSATVQKSATADEVAHMLSGQVYWVHGDYRLQPENGVLTQRWEGLPGALLGWTLPDAKHPGWAHADIWTLGNLYLHRLGNPLERMLFWARAMNLIWSLATGALIFLWSRHLFGDLGGLLSLCFFCFCPTFLAHGPLATSDMSMCFFFLACSGAFWAQLQKRGTPSLALSSVLFGLACVAKFSAILLAPIFGLLALAWLVLSKTDRAARLRWLGASALAHTGIAIFIIWLFYGFRHSPASASMPPMEDYYRSWSMIRESLGAKGELLWAISQWHLLPDPFVFGFAHVVSLAQMRGAFFNGDYSLTGWIGFFPYAFVVKSPLAFLAACLFGGWIMVRARALRSQSGLLQAFLPLMVLFAVIWAFSIGSNLNIGHRHILPVYPPLFIALGCLAWPFAAKEVSSQAALRKGAPHVLVAGLVAFQIVESLGIRPHYLAFFNPLAGGPSRAYRHLVDSSLDWGQDLPGLASRLRQRSPAEAALPVYLSYFGTADPAYYGIKASPLPWIPANRSLEPWAPLRGGLYCISATMLQHVYSPLRGPWTLSFEREYQDLRGIEEGYYRFDRSMRAGRDASAKAITDDAVKWHGAWNRFNLLRFARLCHYLRAREPDETIGYSILIYHLTDEQVAAACAGPFSALQALIERTASGTP